MPLAPRPAFAFRLFAGLCALVPISDSNAQITWRRTYGGFGTDQAASVRQLSDGGYIIAGSTGSFGFGTSDMYVVRVDEFGTPVWSHTYGGPSVETGVACRELADGFIVAGSASPGPNGGYDMMLVRTDGYGDPLWERFYGSADWDLLNAMDVLSDGFVLGGLSYGMGYPIGCASIIRTDNDGQELWRTSLGGTHRMECRGLKATSDGGIVVVGTTGTDDREDDGFFTKLDANGMVQWTVTVGGDSLDHLNSVIEVTGGGYVALGATRSQIETQQIYLAMVDLAGELVWERFIGSGADAGGTEVVRGHGSNEFVFTGYNTLNLGARDMILTRTDAGGWWQAGANYGDGRPADGYAVDITDDGGYVVAGWAEGYGPGIRAMYVVKTGPDLTTASLAVNPYVDPLPVEEVHGRTTLPLYPNPVRPGEKLHVDRPWAPGHTMRLADASGRTLVQGPWAEGGFAMPDLAEGWYLLCLEDRSGARLQAPFLLRR